MLGMRLGGGAVGMRLGGGVVDTLRFSGATSLAVLDTLRCVLPRP